MTVRKKTQTERNEMKATEQTKSEPGIVTRLLCNLHKAQNAERDQVEGIIQDIEADRALMSKIRALQHWIREEIKDLEEA